MDIGIGLPNAIPGASGDQQIEFAQRADAAGFSTLGTIDRLVYPTYEPLIALAAAAAATERIRLATTILIAPYHRNAALLAKQAATLQRLSGGRLSLGLGLGWRTDDYEASGVDFTRRGEVLDEMLPAIRSVWEGSGRDGTIGPDVSSDPPELILGGTVKRSFERAARYGDGWMLGGGTPEQFAECRQALQAEWQAAGREGRPRMSALVYYALGESGAKDADANLGHYYAPMGEAAQGVVDSAAKDPETVRAYIQAFADVGCDELVMFPSSADPAQVDLLAEAAL